MAAMFELGPEAGGIRRDTAAPLHAQISTAIRSRIVTGEWPEDHRLSPEPQLAEEIGVSRGTLRRALATLIDEGLLRQIRGRGTFVTRSPMEPAAAQRLSTLSEDFASQGLDLETTILEAGLRPAPHEVALLLGVPAEAPVFRLVRIRHTGGTPIALVHNYVVPGLAPGIERIDFSHTALFGALEGRYGLAIDSARRSFSAVSASEEVADALALPVGAPVQYLEQLTSLVDRRPVEYSDVWIDSSRLRVVTYMSRRTQERKRNS
jgi:DNA-binding GntR family transcriptional regulator